MLLTVIFLIKHVNISDAKVFSLSNIISNSDGCCIILWNRFTERPVLETDLQGKLANMQIYSPKARL
jgi:hypothetical protein